MDSLSRAVKTNQKVSENRQSMIGDLITNLKVMNPNASLEWLYEQKRYLEQKSDLQLQNMIVINCM